MPDNDLNHLYPPFRIQVIAVLNDMKAWCKVHKPDFTPILFEGFRSQARQDELYAQGRTKLVDEHGNKLPIVTKIRVSNHTSCLAADIIATGKDGKPCWDLGDEFFAYLRHCAHVHGLEETQDYSGFVDEDHVQWPHTDKATYMLAAKWRDQMGLK